MWVRLARSYPSSGIAHGPFTVLMVLRTYALYNFDPKIPILFTTITLIGGTVTTVSSTVHMMRNYIVPPTYSYVLGL